MKRRQGNIRPALSRLVLYGTPVPKLAPSSVRSKLSISPKPRQQEFPSFNATRRQNLNQHFSNTCVSISPRLNLESPRSRVILGPTRRGILSSDKRLKANYLKHHITKNSSVLCFPKNKVVEHGKIKRWRPIEVIGQGSEGLVFKAFDIDLGTIFAVKRLNTTYKADSQEVNILKRVSHESIVKFIGSECIDDSTYIYLEFLPKGNLKTVLSRKGPLSEQSTKRQIKQLAMALAYLHTHGIVHGDIKCANLLVSAENQLKLSDFGSAKLYRSTCETGALCTLQGSLAWAAPEIIQQKGYGPKCDVWSVGCTVLEMLTGRAPWEGDFYSVFMKLANSDEVPQVPSKCSNIARDFIQQCLKRDPAKRPAVIELLSHEFLVF